MLLILKSRSKSEHCGAKVLSLHHTFLFFQSNQNSESDKQNTGFLMPSLLLTSIGTNFTDVGWVKSPKVEPEWALQAVSCTFSRGKDCAQIWLKRRCGCLKLSVKGSFVSTVLLLLMEINLYGLLHPNK